MKNHTYEVKIEWVGNEGCGTATYKSYNRNHNIQIIGKSHDIQGSADPSFLGDKSRYNPEELFLSSISSCHMLWYLHLCAVNDITVIEYLDNPTGIMTEEENGSGRFTSITLYPKVRITDQGMINKANKLHKEANKMCFIANSCNFDIEHESIIFI